MTERDWRIEHLMESDRETKRRLSELERFQYATVEKLKAIYERLKNIEKSNKWVNQSFIYLLSGGIVTAIGSLIVWLIKGGLS